MALKKENCLALYGGIDPRELPSYTLPEAAHHTGVPLPTLRTWTEGRTYKTETGNKRIKPVILRPDPGESLLSFTNLVEAHVLNAIRRHHQIPMYKVRAALDYLEKKFSSRHPLAEEDFQTDGVDLFVERFGALINVSQHGQLAMQKLLELYLKRIERDESGFARRLYPFVRKRSMEVTSEEPRIIVIDPFVSFGRPIIRGTGISTSVIAGRFNAGEGINDLADDYNLSQMQIEEALRFESKAA
ncbi:MAG TPA: DUF433 domain-containing protein [Blastocatellia bacterium]|nr:DUF433 domain-containing protein [Blastocatellia bacterium]